MARFVRSMLLALKKKKRDMDNMRGTEEQTNKSERRKDKQ